MYKDFDKQADLLYAFQWGAEYARSGKSENILEEFKVQFGVGDSEYHDAFDRGVEYEEKKDGNLLAITEKGN